jgi:HK97 family phage prohead protease
MQLEFKAAPDGTIQGYASTFGGEPDSHGDIVMPGAFAKSIADHRAANSMPLMLWAHDADSLPIGTWHVLREDATGLWAEGQLNLSVAKAREILSALRSKATGSLSIGFLRATAVRAPGKKSGTRELHRADLVEISLVNFPANPRAKITSAKSSPFALRISAATAQLKELH